MRCLKVLQPKPAKCGQLFIMCSISHPAAYHVVYYASILYYVMLKTHPATWYEARWPYPRPSVIRNKSQWEDAQGRSYVAVDKRDMTHLGLQTYLQWYWCALPASENVVPLEVGDMIESSRGRYFVRDVSLDAMPRRKVMIVAIK